MFRTWYRQGVKRIYSVGLGQGRTSARKKSCRHLQLEALESRLAPFVHTWNGSTSALWSNSGNWDGGPPVSGETNVVLKFIFASAFRNLTNDIPGLTVQEIDFADPYTLGGDGITLAGDTTINVISTFSTINLDLNLTGTSSMHVFNVGSFGNDFLTVNGLITSAGSQTLVKEGQGSLQLLNGTNSYAGNTVINQGALDALASSAVPASTSVTVNAGAAFEIGNGNFETIGSLTGVGTVFVGGTLGGALSVGVDNSSTTFSGVISGPGFLVKVGTGTFTLGNVNIYTGDTLIEGGTLQVGVNNTIPAASGVAIDNGSTFDLHGNSDTISFLADNTLKGVSAVTLGDGSLTIGANNASSQYFGVISGSSKSKLVKTGFGTFTLFGANTYSGQTIVQNGVLKLGGNNAVPKNSAVTLTGFKIGFIPVFATLDLNNFNDTIGSLSSNPFAEVRLGTGNLNTGGDNSSTTFAGFIQGTGALVKSGTGAFTLTGNNKYTGPTIVQNGTLLDNSSASDVTLTTGTLSGVGTVASIDAHGGTRVSPGTPEPGNSGYNPGNPGILHCTTFAKFDPLSEFQVRLDSKTSFDQLVVGSLAVLGGATLTVTVNYLAQVAGTPPPPLPDTFTIISAAVGVSGTFNHLPDGATLTAASGTVGVPAQRFQIHYTPTSVILTRVAGPVTHFQIDTLSTTQAGTPFDFKVTALDTGNNIVTLFTGAVNFSSQDPFGARLPDDYTFTIGDGGDNGVHTFSDGATLFTAGTWDVTATVLSTGASSGAFVSVTPAPAASFVILAPATSQAGAAFDLTLAAQDPYGNIDTNYQGTVHFTTSTPSGGQVPADYTFTAADSGVHTFPAGAALVTAGNQTITASDTVSGINGGAAVVVTPAPANHFALAAPAQATVGVAFDLTVTALDPYGNTATSYQGTVHFSTSDTDPGVLLPADSTFQASDQGVHTFSGGVMLVTPGDQTLTATDTQSGITGSATVTVNPGGNAPPGGGAVGPDGPGSTPLSNPTGPLPTWRVQPDPRAAAVDQLFAALPAQESEFRFSRFKHHRADDSTLLDVFREEDGLLV